MANKAYKFRIYPNREQKTLFAKTFGCVRFIYNKMLDDKIKYYEKTKKKLNNTPAQYKKEFPWNYTVLAGNTCSIWHPHRIAMRLKSRCS